MQHATSETLESIDALLRQLRGRQQLIERTPGCFYFKSKAFLHFHDDPSGIYADLKRDTAGFSRMRCTSREEQSKLIQCVDRALRERDER